MHRLSPRIRVWCRRPDRVLYILAFTAVVGTTFGISVYYAVKNIPSAQSSRTDRASHSLIPVTTGMAIFGTWLLDFEGYLSDAIQ